MTDIPTNPIDETGPVRVRALAGELDCFTEDDVCVLLDIERSTARNWRARRMGPDFITAGNRCFYPKRAFARWLESRTKTTAT